MNERERDDINALLDRFAAHGMLYIFFSLSGGEDCFLTRPHRHFDGGAELTSNLHSKRDALRDQQRSIRFGPRQFRNQRLIIGPQQ